MDIGYRAVRADSLSVYAKNVSFELGRERCKETVGEWEEILVIARLNVSDMWGWDIVGGYSHRCLIAFSGYGVLIAKRLFRFDDGGAGKTRNYHFTNPSALHIGDLRCIDVSQYHCGSVRETRY